MTKQVLARVGYRGYVPDRAWYQKPSTWLLGAGAAVALTYGSCALGNTRVVGERTHEGWVETFGSEGLFWKTYEGTLVQEDSDRSVRIPFSIDRQARTGENIPDLVAKLEEAQRTESPVLIREREVLTSFPWRSSSGRHVYSVELR